MMVSHYENWIRFYKEHPTIIPILIFFNKIVTLSGYVMYPAILCILYWNHSSAILYYIIIPGISFVAVSVFRKVYNRPRPYENPQINTLTSRDKVGQSFPSRHVFSYSLISILLISLYPIPGILMLFLTCFLAYLRVILGIHYPSDVCVGATLGIFSGLLTILLS